MAKHRSRRAPTAGARIPWSVPVRRDDVPEQGLHLELVADEATRHAVAELAGLQALPRFAARFDVSRHGDGLKVTGEIAASLGQTCVVTLEPLTSEVREPIDLVFVPAEASGAQARDAIAAIDPEAADEPEVLINGIADLGALATEFLLLAIDPYPRKPGVTFESPASADAGTHPFSALAALKKEQDEK